MKINPISSYNLYQASYKRGIKKTASISAPENTAKTDTITFSAEAVGQRELGQAAGAILNELNRPESPVRLQALQKAVESGSYFVSSDDLADAILNRGILG